MSSLPKKKLQKGPSDPTPTSSESIIYSPLQNRIKPSRWSRKSHFFYLINSLVRPPEGKRARPAAPSHHTMSGFKTEIKYARSDRRYFSSDLSLTCFGRSLLPFSLSVRDVIPAVCLLSRTGGV